MTSPGQRQGADASADSAVGSSAIPRIELPVGEAGFRALAGALPQMLWVSGPQGGVAFISPKWVAFTGASEADLLGDGFRTYVHPDDRAVLAARRSDPDKGDGEQSEQPVEFRLLRHDGAYRLIEARVAYLRNDDGEIAWLIGSAFDVTDDREAEAQARERRDQLNVALNATGLARYAYYPSEPRIVGDGRLNEILGVDLEAVVREQGLAGMIAMIHPEDASTVYRGIEAALAGGPDYDVEYRFIRSPAGGDPEERWIAARGRAELNAAGEPLRLVGVVEDITERRQEDEARLQAQKLEAIGTLASGIAHDFNNVLSAILSSASLAEVESAAGAPPHESLREITRAARRASDMVRRLLAASREEAPTPAEFDVSAVVQEACGLLGPTLPGSIEFTCTIGSNLPQVVGDATQIHQLTLNLVNNASHAVGDHGAVALAVDQVVLDAAGAGELRLRPGPYVAIQVTDDGVGMPADLIARVFDPYFTTRPSGKGTGLGLTASRRIAHNHGGEIEIRSEPGKGSTVTAYVPATRSITAPDAPDAPIASQRSATTATADVMASGSGGARVLFVDDELALVRLAERALPMAGFRAAAFDRPHDAVEALAADPSAFDVLVTDLSMPGLSGIELIAEVRKIRPDLPVVLSSGYLTPEHRAEAERLRVDAFVAKPCSVGDLGTAITRVIAAAD